MATTSDVRVLAELMGWKKCKVGQPYHSIELGKRCWISPNGGHYCNGGSINFDTDLNAMLEVWNALKEKGLWDEFIAYWQSKGIFRWDYMKPSEVYDLLVDLPGQVKAANEVLKRAQG